MVSLQGVQHVGVAVSDLARSLTFYADVLDVHPAFVAEGGGDALSQAVGVPDADLKFAFLKVGDSVLELLEYTQPTGRAYALRNCDVGAVHIAFAVDDIDAMCKTLESRGVKFNAPPLQIDEGPLAGSTFAYFTDPDGVQLELFQVAAECA